MSNIPKNNRTPLESNSDNWISRPVPIPTSEIERFNFFKDLLLPSNQFWFRKGFPTLF